MLLNFFRVKALRSAIRFVKNSDGAEVTELAVVLGLIVAGCVATIALIGPTIVGFYGTVEAALNP